MKGFPVVTFIFGAAAGAFVSWRLLKKKYEQRTEKEIASVKEAFERHAQNDQSEETVSKAVDSNEDIQHDIKQTADILVEQKYVPNVPNIPKSKEPYTIEPDEFGAIYEYNKVYLVYFQDGVVADSEYDILTSDEIEESIGYDALRHFGEYDEDSVWVRNDAKRSDYEITKDLRNYSDLTAEQMI